MRTKTNNAKSAETMPLVFKSPRGRRLKLSGGALSTMYAFIQDGPSKKEAGGVLLGRVIKDTEEIVIDLATTPQKKDRRSRFRFFRNKAEHQEIIEREWGKSRGTCNYLGDWHTHPENFPVPSSVDVKNWKRQANKTESHGVFLYFIIVGLKEVAVYRINKTTLKITKLKIA